MSRHRCRLGAGAAGERRAMQAAAHSSIEQPPLAGHGSTDAAAASALLTQFRRRTAALDWRRWAPIAGSLPLPLRRSVHRRGRGGGARRHPRLRRPPDPSPRQRAGPDAAGIPDLPGLSTPSTRTETSPRRHKLVESETTPELVTIRPRTFTRELHTPRHGTTKPGAAT